MSEMWLPSASDQEDMQGPTVNELLETIAQLQATLAAREATPPEVQAVLSKLLGRDMSF